MPKAWVAVRCCVFVHLKNLLSQKAPKHMKKFYAGCCIAILVWMGCTPRQQADLLVYNAHIYTLDDQFSTAPAMAIADGKILATGTASDLRAQYDFQEVLDAEGQPVYPGLLDAHCHFVGYAQFLNQVDLTGARSVAEVLERCVAFHQKNQGAFVIGRGWDQNLWERKVFPDKTALDSLFPDIPVILKRVDGHATWVNSAALRLNNVACNDQLLGGRILCTDNQPTGILIDNAMDLVADPAEDPAEKARLLVQAQRNLFAMGLTTLADAGLSLKDILLLDSLHQTGTLQMRVYAMAADQPDNWAYWAKEGILKTDRLHVRSFKVYGDGALGSRGASLLAPYSDAPDEYGFLLQSKDYFEEAARRCVEMGFQMNSHAIGDSANRTLLKIYGVATKNLTDHRWRIEHAQVVAPDDFARFAVGIIPSVQPTHATSDMYWAGDRLGAERLPYAYAFKKLYDQNKTIALGTDFPVEDISPFKTFYAAVVRKDADGYPEQGFNPENALSRELALRGMTHLAAHANFEEHEKGRLVSGYLADFIILDRDLMQISESEILQTQVLKTYVGGKLVHQKKKLNP